jgi:hypothetical protein
LKYKSRGNLSSKKNKWPFLSEFYVEEFGAFSDEN